MSAPFLPPTSIGLFGQAVATQLAQRMAQQADEPDHAFFCASSLPLKPFTAHADGLPAEASLVGVFLFERFLLITPRLRARQGLCAHCYTQRLLSHPPHPLLDFVVRAAERVCSERLEFEYTGWSPGVAALAAELAWGQAQGKGGRAALAVDIGNLNVLANVPVALHGCRCRQSRTSEQHQGTRRFTAFVPELPASLRAQAGVLEGQA